MISGKYFGFLVHYFIHLLVHLFVFRALYSSYCQNMPSARQAITDLGGEANPASILHHCQAEAGHQLPLSSYLLKPMQRLTKYQLLLKDLVESSNIGKTPTFYVTN